MKSNPRKRFALLAVAVASVLAVGSVAWACTVFKGKMTLSAGSGTSSAIGNGAGMVHCAGSTPTAGATVSPSGSMEISVEPASCGGTSYQLTADDYIVTYLPIKNATAAIDCMNPTVVGGTGVPIGRMQVDSDGTSSSGAFTPLVPIVENPGTESVSICISSDESDLAGVAEGMLVNAGYIVV